MTIEQIKEIAKNMVEAKLLIEKANQTLRSAESALTEDQKQEGSLLTSINFVNIDNEFWEIRFDRDGDFDCLKKTIYLVMP